MNINWLEEVEKRQDLLLKDLFRLLKIESVREDDLATEEAPVGPGPLAALKEFLSMAQEDGFETEQFGPWAGHVKLGQGEELLGILGHVDVVPAGTGWDTEPFEPQLINNRIYGRGSSDDKGPTVAAYFAIKLLRELGIEFNKRIHLIVGTDEESGWQCMDYYFQHAPMPDLGFSPDATFPIINGEKGNVSALFNFEVGENIEGDLKLVQFKSGLRPNMVPQDATAVIEVQENDLVGELTKAYDAFFNDYENLSGDYTISDLAITLNLSGKAAHGSTPEKGINAGTHLAKFLEKYSFDTQGSQDFIHLLARELYLGFNGQKLNVHHNHEVMGEVSMNVGIISFDASEGGHIDVNFRFPEGTTPEKMEEQIKKHLIAYTVNVSMSDFKEPHYVPADDSLVKTLLSVYERQTGEKGEEQTIGGGTYGRLMPRGVAFGALFPDSIDTMHQANEFIALDDLLKATAIYAESIYELTR
ncbi:dipeptidase PepV [Aerococcaceae bacterium WGS1372]